MKPTLARAALVVSALVAVSGCGGGSGAGRAGPASSGRTTSLPGTSCYPALVARWGRDQRVLTGCSGVGGSGLSQPVVVTPGTIISVVARRRGFTVRVAVSDPRVLRPTSADTGVTAVGSGDSLMYVGGLACVRPTTRGKGCPVMRVRVS